MRDDDYSAGMAVKLFRRPQYPGAGSQHGGNIDQMKNWRLMRTVYGRDLKLRDYIEHTQ